MTTLNLSNWSFEYDPTQMDALLDPIRQKIIFLTKECDDIHLIIEIIAGKLVFNPRWSAKITNLTPETYLIETNRV